MKTLDLLLWEVDVIWASSTVAAGLWFLKHGKVSCRGSLQDLGANSMSSALEDGQILNKSLSRPIKHSWREVTLHHLMAQHASFTLSSLLAFSLASFHSSPLTPTPRSTCTWGSRSRSSACSPRASPPDSLSGPPRRSPAKQATNQAKLDAKFSAKASLESGRFEL